MKFYSLYIFLLTLFVIIGIFLYKSIITITNIPYKDVDEIEVTYEVQRQQICTKIFKEILIIDIFEGSIHGNKFEEWPRPIKEYRNQLSQKYWDSKCK